MERPTQVHNSFFFKIEELIREAKEEVAVAIQEERLHYFEFNLERKSHLRLMCGSLRWRFSIALFSEEPACEVPELSSWESANLNDK